MKTNLQVWIRELIQSVGLFCLLILPLCSISGTVTKNDSTEVSKYLPYIVRDLKICDVIKEENTLLKQYNSILIQTATQYNTERIEAVAEKETAIHDKDKYRRRSRTYGVLFGGHLVLDVILLTLILL